MPYQVAQGHGCPAATPYAVVKTTDGTRMGCHPTAAAAQRQVAALYANEAMNTAIRRGARRG